MEPGLHLGHVLRMIEDNCNPPRYVAPEARLRRSIVARNLAEGVHYYYRAPLAGRIANDLTVRDIAIFFLSFFHVTTYFMFQTFLNFFFLLYILLN